MELLRDFVETRMCTKYEMTPEEVNELRDEYNKMPAFKINESCFEVGIDVSEEMHYFMRLNVQYHLTNAFEAMKVDLSDSNVVEDYTTGNIGTPGRVAKMWCGGSLNDDSEHLSGRWSKMPRIASFPNTMKTHQPITKRVSLMSVCSHHIAPFSTLFNEESVATIAYVPGETVIGISKLQRLVEAISRRGWLQEDLTKKIYEEVSKVCGTDSVSVKLENVEHTCETTRGAKNPEGGFTSICEGGSFLKLNK